jgi:hypothetical protein
MKKTFYVMILLLAAVVLFTQCKKEVPVEKTTISGQIINSQNGSGLANATLSFCEPFAHGLKSTAAVTPVVVFKVITNSSGQYTTTEAVVGTYTLMIEATNFFTLYIDNYVIASGLTSTLPPITLVQTLSNSLLRIVLTWGQTPYDLDSHLTGPTAGSSTRFHVYFSNDRYNPASSITPIIILDTDDTSSFGPETTTINSWQAGTYRYSVFNYSDQTVAGGGGIKNSPASVQIYGPTGLLKTYAPATFTANGGNTWVVFEMTVTANGSYTITDKNIYVNSTASDAVTKK